MFYIIYVSQLRYEIYCFVYKSTYLHGTLASAYSFASASASECGLQAAGGQVPGHGGATLISTFDNIEIKSGEEGHVSRAV